MPTLVNCLLLFYLRATGWEVLNFWSVLTGHWFFVVTWLPRSNHKKHSKQKWWRRRHMRWLHLRHVSPPKQCLFGGKNTALRWNFCWLWNRNTYFAEIRIYLNPKCVYNRSGRDLRSWTQIVRSCTKQIIIWREKEVVQGISDQKGSNIGYDFRLHWS